jgi:hypothetical protein
MTKSHSAVAGSAILAGVAALVAIFTLVPSIQAETRERSTASNAVKTHFDKRSELVRFYVGGKEVANLDGAAVRAHNPRGR